MGSLLGQHRGLLLVKMTSACPVCRRKGQTNVSVMPGTPATQTPPARLIIPQSISQATMSVP